MNHVLEGATLAAPHFRCPKCGGELSFDEVSQRYFAFLRHA